MSEKDGLTRPQQRHLLWLRSDFVWRPQTKGDPTNITVLRSLERRGLAEWSTLGWRLTPAGKHWKDTLQNA